MSCSTVVNYSFEAGDIDNIAITVTATGGLTVENEAITIYKCADMSEILASTDISANTTAITDGHQLLHCFDSTGLAAGRYMAMFEFNRDGLPKLRHKRVYIELKELAC